MIGHEDSLTSSFHMPDYISAAAMGSEIDKGVSRWGNIFRVAAPALLLNGESAWWLEAVPLTSYCLMAYPAGLAGQRFSRSIQGLMLQWLLLWRCQWRQL